MTTENLKFKLELWGEYWDKAPFVRVLINNEVHFRSEIKGSEKEPILIEFEQKLIEGENYKLIIERVGKDKKQTMVNNNGEIIKDQLLHIKSIEIDEIDIGALVYEAVYTPEYPEPWASQQQQTGNILPKSFKNVTTIGHNGTWKLSFASPFYMWLLENLY